MCKSSKQLNDDNYEWLFQTIKSVWFYVHGVKDVELAASEKIRFLCFQISTHPH